MKKIVLILVIFLFMSISYSEERIEDISKLEKKDEIIYVINENEPYSGLFIKIYKNGNIQREEKYINGIICEVKSYYKNGQLSLIDTYQNGKVHGECRMYYKNGQLALIGEYKNGQAEGIHKSYYENGNSRGDINYK